MDEEQVSARVRPRVRARISVLDMADRISASFAYIAGFVTLIMLLHIVADVISRNLFTKPLAGTTEYSQYWYMPALVFLALAFTELKDEHIKATLLIDGLPPGLRRIAELGGYFLALLATCVLGYFALLAADSAAAIGQTALGVVTVYLWVPKYVMLLGFVLLAFQIAVRIIRLLKSPLPEAGAAEELPVDAGEVL